MMSKQRSGKMYHMVTVWSSGKSHDSHPLTALMWFVTLMLEMITGEFSLSNKEDSKYLFISGELREAETESIADAGRGSLWHQKELTPKINTFDCCPSTLSAAFITYYR